MPRSSSARELLGVYVIMFKVHQLVQARTLLQSFFKHPYVPGNYVQVRQVFGNIIYNFAKTMKNEYLIEK